MRRYTKKEPGCEQPIPSALLLFLFGLISPLCAIYGRPDCFVSRRNWRFALCHASDWFFIRWSNDDREQTETLGKTREYHKTGRYGSSSQPSSSISIITPTTLSTRIGTDNPISISKNKTQRSFFVSCFRLLALLFRNWYG
jgi:hypothetical protein